MGSTSTGDQAWLKKDVPYLNPIDCNISYDDLICYSGFAFRIGIHEQMCPSAGHPCCGFMCMDGAHRALPWRAKLFEAFPWGEKREDLAAFEAEACAAIKQSIDRGVPAHYGSEEDGLIIGYADEGRILGRLQEQLHV